MILNSPYISGSITVTGNATIQGTISGSVSGTASNATTASFAATASSADNLLVRNTLTAQTLVVQTVTSSIVYSSGSNVFGNNIANTQVMTGSVLISGSINILNYTSSNPAAALMVNGAISAISQESKFAYGTWTDPNSGTVYDAKFGGNQNGIAVKGTSYFSGSVGIGTASPVERLEVFSSEVAGTSQQTKIRITQAASVSSRVNLIAGVISGSDPYFAIEARQSSTPFAVVERLRIDGNGNVGIGTSSPVSSANYVFTTTNGTNGSGYVTQVNGTTALYSYSNANESRLAEQRALPLIFETSGTERMRITSGGVLQIVGSGYNRNALQSSYFGYNGVYRTLLIGSSGTDYTTNAVTLAFGVDISSNTNGSFTGNGSEYIWRNTGTFLTPNSANNAYNTIMSWGSGGAVTFPNSIRSLGESLFYYGSYSDPGPGTAYDAKFGGTSGGGIAVRGNSVFIGSVSKGGGSFRIDHPLPEKRDTHFLLHSFIEGPTPDLIYRGVVNLVDGTATINIDEVSDMTEGTFVLLNKRVQCFTTNESGWDLTKGKVEGNILTITSQNPESTDEISWMVIGERNDEWMQNSDMTDENGKIIVEKEKPIIIE